MGAGTGRLPVDVACVLQSCKLHEENIREQEEAGSEIYSSSLKRNASCALPAHISAWGSLSGDEQHACVQDYLINHSSQHVLQARAGNGMSLQWIRISFIKDASTTMCGSEFLKKLSCIFTASWTVGILLVVVITCMVQYSKAVASTHPNADAIVTTSERRQLDAS